MPSLKTIPIPTISNTLPPNLTYKYFENAAAHPFRYNAKAFDLRNAWWLAESALLAYADSLFVQSEFQRAGLTGFKLIVGNNSGTQCFVAHNADFVVIAFRGTQVPQKFDSPFLEIVKDIFTDAKAILSDSKQGGKAHTGFLDAWREVKVELLSYLKSLQSDHPKITFWFTGHSLGAALATLAADSFGAVQGLYTFGSPRVGDASFRDDFHVLHYRILIGDDIVTKVPIEPYVHVGQEKHIDEKDELRDGEYESLLRNLTVNSKLNLFINQQMELRIGSLPQLSLIGGFLDHSPWHYALRVWNCYVKSL